MKPLVTIITPSYNQGRFIRETIESVLNQDYENIEYIIVDGQSTDETLKIIKQYNGKLSYISEKDNGQSDAINKGFKMAHGEIVAWLNSDDVYEPGCIKRAVREFEKNSRLGLIYGDGYILDEQGCKIRGFENTQEFDFWKLVNFWDYIMQPTTFFRKEFLEKVGYLDVKLNYCMDWDLWIKLASVSEVKYVPELLACSREYALTKTSTGGEERLEELSKLLRKYSGKQMPLGIRSYKASTFYTKHQNDIWPIKKIVGWYLTWKHNRLLKQIPEKYKDGWMRKKYEFCIPGYYQQLVIEIQEVLPPGLKKIKIGIDDEEAVTYSINNGKIVLPLSNERNLHTVLIQADKVRKIGNGDSRKVSVRLEDSY